MIVFCYVFLMTTLGVNLNAVDVFTPGEGGYPCIRIPSIVETSNHTLVAFAEC